MVDHIEGVGDEEEVLGEDEGTSISELSELKNLPSDRLFPISSSI